MISLKLTSDKCLEYKNRRVVTFRLEEDDTLPFLSLKLASFFNQANMVVTSPMGEHRLPTGICSKEEYLDEALDGVRIFSLEIGESRGYNPVTFLIKPEAHDLICYGPLDFDFYGLITDLGIEFGL